MVGVEAIQVAVWIGGGELSDGHIQYVALNYKIACGLIERIRDQNIYDSQKQQ